MLTNSKGQRDRGRNQQAGGIFEQNQVVNNHLGEFSLMVAFRSLNG